MSEADIQGLLDCLAADLGAGLVLSDVDDRVLAHTAHGDQIDDVRRWGILHRRTRPDVVAWFEQWGIHDAVAPVRTPADESLHVLARWCVPVRFRSVHLGYIWVLDAEGIDEARLAPAVDSADQIGALLYRRRLSYVVDTDLLRLLLIPNPESNRVAADALALGGYRHRGPIAIILVGTANGDELSARPISDLEVVLHRAGEQTATGAALTGVISGLGVLLAPLRTRDDLSPARRLAEMVRRLAALVSDELELVTAIGSPTEVERATDSYVEAQRALKMARAQPDLGPIVAWDDLGFFRAIALLPDDEVQNGATDTRVRNLLRDDALTETAETFLDLAGNVQATAARLYLHRTTLYQRLDRIEELYHLDLRRNGDHRLITHVGLRLARIAHR